MDTDLERRIAGGEGADLELKATLADSRKIIETIAAMATSGGGTVVIGVRDDGEVLGASIGGGEHERLIQQILAATDPRLYVQLDEPVVNGKRLLRIQVPPGDGPHLAFGRAFQRVGRATVQLSRDEYERKLLDRLRESSGFERRPVDGVTLDDLDPAAIERWCQQAQTRMPALPSQASPREVVEQLHLASGERISVAGWLMFGNAPSKPFPQAVIRAHAQRGASSDSAVLDSVLSRQIDDAVAFVGRNLRVGTRIEGVRRTEHPELPLVAVRELIANAVAHRDYRSGAACQLRVTDDAVELWNPGHLPAPITPALLHQQHPSVPVNPLIARALFLAGYIEEWGTGTLRMIEALKQNGNPPPRFVAGAETGVLVTLPLSASVGLAAGRAASTLARFTAAKPFTSSQYAARAKVGLRTAATDLKGLEAQGLVKRVGVGRATRWVRL